MSERITAEEARKKSTTLLGEKVKQQLDKCEEYTHRYGKRHKSQDVIEWCLVNMPNIKENGDITPFALAMPDECKLSSAVDSYRLYYIMHKRSFSSWKNREKPMWFEVDLIDSN